MELRQILKRSLRVCFDFDGSKFTSSGDLSIVKYFIHQVPHCEFIQLRKCQRGVFQNHGVCGQAFPFLASRASPSPLPSSVLRSPQFLRRQKAKNASNGWKTLRKRLLRRLILGRNIFLSYDTFFRFLTRVFSLHKFPNVR